MKKIIVTVTDRHSFSYELELPADVPIKELYSDIANTLNRANQGNNYGCSLIRHYGMFSKRNEKYLMPEDTFQSAKVYSGDTIIIVETE